MKLQHLPVEWIIKNFGEIFGKFRVTEEKIHYAFRNDERPIPNSKIKDWVWSHFQDMVTELAKAHLQGKIATLQYIEDTKDVYWQMLILQRRFENKKANHVFNQILKFEILRFEEQNFEYKDKKFYIIPISKNCCPYCDSLDGKFFPIEEAVINPPVDANKCTNELGCRTSYGGKFI